MTERLPKRHHLPGVVLAACVLFASVLLSSVFSAVAVGPASVAQASQAAMIEDTWVNDSRSPVGEMSQAGIQRQVLAAVAARQRERAVAAAKKAAADPTPAQATAGTPGGAVPVAGLSSKSREIQSLVTRQFPADQVGNAMAVATCESGLSDSIGATNSDGTTDWGVFQLNDGGTLQGALSAVGVAFGSMREAQKLALDTETNVKAAASIYADRGWAPWVCAYKIGVVAALYSNTPGPMAGKFDEWGKPTVPVPVINVGPGGSNDSDGLPNQGNGDSGNGADDPEPTRSKPPVPSASPTSSVRPVPSATATTPATPTLTPTPTPPPTPDPVPSATPTPTGTTPIDPPSPTVGLQGVLPAGATTSTLG